MVARIQADGVPAVALVGQVAIEQVHLGRDAPRGRDPRNPRGRRRDRRRQPAARPRDEHFVGVHALRGGALGRSLGRGEAQHLSPGQGHDQRDRGGDRADAEAAGAQRTRREEPAPARRPERLAGERRRPADDHWTQQDDGDHEAERGQRRIGKRMPGEHHDQRDAAAERDQPQQRADDAHPAVRQRGLGEGLAGPDRQRAVRRNHGCQQRHHAAGPDRDRVRDPHRCDREPVGRDPHRHQRAGEPSRQRTGGEAAGRAGGQPDQHGLDQQHPPHLGRRSPDRADQRELAPPPLDRERHRPGEHEDRDPQRDPATRGDHRDQLDPVERARVARVGGRRLPVVEHLGVAADGGGDAATQLRPCCVPGRRGPRSR